MRPRKHPTIRDGSLGGQGKEFFTNLAEDRLENLKNLENQPIGIKNLISHEERFKTDDEDSVHVRTNVTTFLAPIRPYRFEAKGLIPHNRCRPLVLTRRDPGLIEEESVHSSVIARNRVFRLKSSLQSPPKAERLRRIRLRPFMIVLPSDASSLARKPQRWRIIAILVAVISMVASRRTVAFVPPEPTFFGSKRQSNNSPQSRSSTSSTFAPSSSSLLMTGQEAPTTFREAEILGLRLMQEENYEEALKGS
jgi:hypothetical protein